MASGTKYAVKCGCGAYDEQASRAKAEDLAKRHTAIRGCTPEIIEVSA